MEGGWKSPDEMIRTEVAALVYDLGIQAKESESRQRAHSVRCAVHRGLH